jgi:hypothetical protein
MPSNPLITFIMCVMNENNEFVPTHSIYKARDSLAAAKKAFRAHKILKIIHVLNTNNNNIYSYDTSTFFTKKKEHKQRR